MQIIKNIINKIGLIFSAIGRAIGNALIGYGTGVFFAVLFFLYFGLIETGTVGIYTIIIVVMIAGIIAILASMERIANIVLKCKEKKRKEKQSKNKYL